MKARTATRAATAARAHRISERQKPQKRYSRERDDRKKRERAWKAVSRQELPEWDDHEAAIDDVPEQHG